MIRRSHRVDRGDCVQMGLKLCDRTSRLHVRRDFRILHHRLEVVLRLRGVAENLHKLILLTGLDREHIDESNRGCAGLIADGMQTSTGKRCAALLANPGRKISRHETFSISMRMDGSYRRGGTFERAFCSIHRGATAQTRGAAHETDVDHYRRTQRGFELRLVPVPAWPATEGACA